MLCGINIVFLTVCLHVDSLSFRVESGIIDVSYEWGKN